MFMSRALSATEGSTSADSTVVAPCITPCASPNPAACAASRLRARRAWDRTAGGRLTTNKAGQKEVLSAKAARQAAPITKLLPITTPAKADNRSDQPRPPTRNSISWSSLEPRYVGPASTPAGSAATVEASITTVRNTALADSAVSATSQWKT